MSPRTTERKQVAGDERLTLDRVSRVISTFGKQAGIVVNVNAKNGKVKYASAHDFRRVSGTAGLYRSCHRS
jgi:hypothetical protein